MVNESSKQTFTFSGNTSKQVKMDLSARQEMGKQGDTTPAPPSSPSRSSPSNSPVPVPLDLIMDPINQELPPPEPQITPEAKSSQSQGTSKLQEHAAMMERIAEYTDLPTNSLEKLEEMLNRPRWVVPVLPGQDLEILLETCRSMAERGLPDTQNVTRFVSGSLALSFRRLMDDDAVRDWKPEIQRCIFNCSERFVQLFVLKLSQADDTLFHILSHVFNPKCRYHAHNNNKPSETGKEDETFCFYDASIHGYGQKVGACTEKGFLLDLINSFGSLGGFDKFANLFHPDSQIEFSCAKLCALIRPFGLCQQYLLDEVVQQYLNPAINLGIEFAEKVTDDELKKESKKEARDNSVYELVTQLRNLVSRAKDNRAMPVEQLRLKIILRMLKVSSFAGRVNALNEIYNILTDSQAGEPDSTRQQQAMALWMLQNDFLKSCLKDNLHQQTYVDRLEKILRRLLTLKVMENEHLAQLWDAHIGKHDVIQNNVHVILAKMAWEFTPAQLDYLFTRFTTGMKEADLKQRQKLLELMRKLAEDDKAGHMAKKVLELLWNLAKDADIPIEVTNLALEHHLKILDQSCYGKRDEAKHEWVTHCVKELTSNDPLQSLLPLKHMQSICMLFQDNTTYNYMKTGTTSYRAEVVGKMQGDHQLVASVSTNLSKYMDLVRQMGAPPGVTAQTWFPDGRFSHEDQLNERLRFLKFLLTEGSLWMCDTQASQLWDALIRNPVLPSDKDTGFKMFTDLLNADADQDLDPDETKKFFEERVVHFEPANLSRWGWACFDRFFRSVNLKDGHLMGQRRGSPFINSADLTGQDYFWRVILQAPDDVAMCAIESFREIYSNPSDEFAQCKVITLHESVIEQCMNTLKANYESLTTLVNTKETNLVKDLTTKLCRVLQLLAAYVSAYDEALISEMRSRMPLWRCSIAKTVMLVCRIASPQTKAPQDQDDTIALHYHNTIAQLRKIINTMACKVGHPGQSVTKLDLYINGELVDCSEDSKTLGSYSLANESIVELRHSCGTTASSPESSGESSPIHDRHLDEKNVADQENELPGVMIASKYDLIKLLFDIADIGSRLSCTMMTQSARSLLDWLPGVNEERRILGRICSAEPCADLGLQGVFFDKSPSRVLYCLSLLYAMLFPTQNNQLSVDLLVNSFKKGGLKVCLAMLCQNNFLHGAEHETKSQASMHLMQLLKMYLYITVRLAVLWKCDDLKLSKEEGAEAYNRQKWIQALQSIAHSVPNEHDCHMLRNAVSPCIDVLYSERSVVEPLIGDVVDAGHVTSLMRLIWVTGSGDHTLTTKHLNEDIEKAYEMNHNLSPRDHLICTDGLEALCLILCLCPNAITVSVLSDKNWKLFIKDMIFCTSMGVRDVAQDIFMYMADKMSCLDHKMTLFFIQLLFSILNTQAETHVQQSAQYFALLCELLRAFSRTKRPLNNGENLLFKELDWLNKAHEYTKAHLESYPQDLLLYGHLRITKELLRFLPTQRLYWFGSHPQGPSIIKQMLDDFLLPSSRLFAEQRKSGNTIPRSQTTTWDAGSSKGVNTIVDQGAPPDPTPTTMSRSKTTICNTNRVVPVCGTQESMREGYHVLVALCRNCPANFNVVATALIDMYFMDSQVSEEWDYAPNVALRGRGAFVGLKNAGATCYMNSVFQQLFMVDSVRQGILNADVPGVEMYDSECEELPVALPPTNEDSVGAKKEYHCNILRCVQLMFANLLGSQIQYFVPRKFWKCFRFNNEPLNPREQQDSLEFYNAIVDSIDEALKSLSQPPICQLTFGGTFADQKICKDCPHRYSREESFTCISVDVRRHDNLLDSLQEYVKGDLLESDNAYLCETCNKKVTAIKRLCIAKLPPMLVMQLKRFDYDWERDQAIKFNDFFHFPTEIDMEPYTVSGVAAMEDDLAEESMAETSKTSCTKYRLKGIIVHSGQASGGHYYSFINVKPNQQGNDVCDMDESTNKWYKFDDGDVTEFDLDAENEMRNQCFGGDYMGENLDMILRRVQPRRQKRWWNAYILFYEQVDNDVDSLGVQLEHMSISTRLRQMPLHLEALVRRHNTKFVHERNQYCHEFFEFMLELAKSNMDFISNCEESALNADMKNETAINTLSLAIPFLFTTGFRAKKVLRFGFRPSRERTYLSDWAETMRLLFTHSKLCRKWMALQVLFTHLNTFSDFLFDCPNQDVRSCFGRILLNLMTQGLDDVVSLNAVPNILTLQLTEPCTITDVLLVQLKTVLINNTDYTKFLNTYFQVLYQFTLAGPAERLLMLKHGVDELYVKVLLDEYPQSLRHIHAPEASHVVLALCQLVNVADLTPYRKTFDGQVVSAQTKNLGHLSDYVADKLLVDPDSIARMQKRLLDQLYSTSGSGPNQDVVGSEVRGLLQNCCWENMTFSKILIQSLVFSGTHGFSQEARPAMHNLWRLLHDLQDSWMVHRIIFLLQGDEKWNGVLGQIDDLKSNSRKVYLIYKLVMHVLHKCVPAQQVVRENKILHSKLRTVYKFLDVEINKPPSNYTYRPQVLHTSNELSINLERTNSAINLIKNTAEFIETLAPDEPSSGDENEVEHIRLKAGNSSRESDVDLEDESNCSLNVSSDKDESLKDAYMGSTAMPPPNTDPPPAYVVLDNEKSDSLRQQLATDNLGNLVHRDTSNEIGKFGNRYTEFVSGDYKNDSSDNETEVDKDDAYKQIE